MIIYPAIDIRGGQCVRLVQGDFTRETVYYKNPVEVAKKWERQGAKWIHVVDLDGAKLGSPQNMDVILEIREAVKANIQLGGGLRDMDTVRKYLDAGINRLVLGSAVIESPSMVRQAVAIFGPDRIAVGIDARKNMVATRGWTRTSGVTLQEFLVKISEHGIQRVIYTDISRDGMMSGPDMEGLKSILSVGRFIVIASGGIASLEDIKRLRPFEKNGLEGVIIGKALYNGVLKLAKIIETFEE